MFQPLGILPGGSRSLATGISGDGTVIVGWTLAPTPATNSYAVRWDLSGAMHFLVPQNEFSSIATAASEEGTIILGNGSGGGAWLWTAAGGREFLPVYPGASSTSGRAISADGLAVTGAMSLSGSGRLIRWTRAGGIENLGTIANQPSISGAAISAEGTVIAGQAGNTFPGHRAIRWTESTGIVVLPVIPGASSCFGRGLSADGNVVVGYCETPEGDRAFRWTAQTGTVSLGTLPGAASRAEAANWDGSVIVGYSLQVWDGAWVWTLEQGMVRISSLLPAAIPPGFQLESARAVSHDGLTIAGDADNPQFMWEAFVLRLPTRMCWANCDGSTVEPILNIDDFTCFINQFATAQSSAPWYHSAQYANCDGSTTPPILNIDDFTCFINRFAAGCK